MALRDVIRDIEKRCKIFELPQDRAMLQDCVLAWCDVLDWDSEVAKNAESLDQLYADHLGRIAFRFGSEVRQRKESASIVARQAGAAKKFGAYLNEGLRSDSKDYTDASDGAMAKMEPRDYILVALAIAAAGYVLYRSSTKPERSVEAPPAFTHRVPDRWVLVLVINAGRESVVDALRSRDVAPLKSDQLYQATQALWLGTEDQFQSSSMSDWFNEAHAVSDPSEYDVHLVRVELASDDSGLHRNANQMDRLDAFRRLQSMGFKATVSPRLPSAAYGTTGVYGR